MGYSPLETNVVGLAKHISHSKANIEHNSVNSILLDSEPWLDHALWMVAASVESPETSDKITIRNTSLMPSRPGLSSLCAMMFAPRVQMRRNKDKTHYTGCLIGLGCESDSIQKNGRSVYLPLNGKNDMEIAFDTNVGPQQVVLVNEIRRVLQSALERGPEGIWTMTQVRHLVSVQRQLEDFVYTLTKMDMKYKEPVGCGSSKMYSWKNPSPTGSGKIFRPIEATIPTPTKPSTR